MNGHPFGLGGRGYGSRSVSVVTTDKGRVPHVPQQQVWHFYGLEHLLPLRLKEVVKKRAKRGRVLARRLLFLRQPFIRTQQGREPVALRQHFWLVAPVRQE